MDSFLESCDKFLEYPKNLVRHDALSHNFQAYHQRLEHQSKDLFDGEQRATVDFLDLNDGDQGYLSNTVRSLSELKHQLREALLPERKDPRCRFVFLHTPHSRVPLRISSDMFMFLFTYHQVMHSFLDFVFPFGRQIYPRDIHFSGFRDESRLTSRQENAGIAELGRSGSVLRLCYNLRSVERSHNQPDLPWSIRQTAVYQEFDIQTGQAFWIVVKGNKLMKSRIMEASKAAPWSKVTSLSDELSTTLATHLLICDWSGENWRWYINDLEEKLQILTKDVLATRVDKDPSPITSPASSDFVFASPQSRASTFPPLSPSAADRIPNSPRVASNQFFIRNPAGSFSPKFPSQAPTLNWDSHLPNTAHDACTTPSRFDFNSLLRQIRKWYAKGLPSRWAKCNHRAPVPSDVEMNATCLPSNGKLIPPERPPTFSDGEHQGPQGEFTFSNLQGIQYIEEKVQEALLVLKLNTDVLEELRQHYIHAKDCNDFPEKLRTDCRDELSRFDRCVLGVKKDMQMLESRTENLLQLLANRKNLLNEILQYLSVQATESLAKKAQESADQMALMTRAMYDIAQKTKQETVSMRVITSVTLFFLPATFIATFMSTDIVNFEHGGRNFQINGLKLYLVIALPLTALTFFAWFVIYRIAKRSGFPSTQSSQDANDAHGDWV